MSCLLNQRGFGKDGAQKQTGHELPGAECCKHGVMRFSGTRPKFVLHLGSVERRHNARQHVRFTDNGGIIGLNACLIPCQIASPNARFMIEGAGCIAESRGVVKRSERVNKSLRFCSGLGEACVWGRTMGWFLLRFPTPHPHPRAPLTSCHDKDPGKLSLPLNKQTKP